MPLEIPGAAGDLLRQAQQQQAAEQMMQQALVAAVNSPHTSERIHQSLAIVVDEGPNKVLLVGTLSGKRYDIVLSPQAVQALARAATPPEKSA